MSPGEMSTVELLRDAAHVCDCPLPYRCPLDKDGQPCGRKQLAASLRLRADRLEAALRLADALADSVRPVHVAGEVTAAIHEALLIQNAPDTQPPQENRKEGGNENA